MAVSNIKALIPGELRKVWKLVLDIENYGTWRSDLSKTEVNGYYALCLTSIVIIQFSKIFLK